MRTNLLPRVKRDAYSMANLNVTVTETVVLSICREVSSSGSALPTAIALLIRAMFEYAL